MKKNTKKNLGRLALMGLIPSLISGCKDAGGNGRSSSEQKNNNSGYETSVPGKSSFFSPKDNYEPAVYGSPEWFEQDGEIDEDLNNSSGNSIEDVFEENDSSGLGGKIIGETAPDVSDDFDPSNNIAEPIYGSPDPTE